MSELGFRIFLVDVVLHCKSREMTGFSLLLLLLLLPAIRASVPRPPVCPWPKAYQRARKGFLRVPQMVYVFEIIFFLCLATLCCALAA